MDRKRRKDKGRREGERVGNTIGIAPGVHSPAELHMSNGGTCVLLDVLALSGVRAARTPQEKRLIVWLSEHDQSRWGLGAVGVDLCELPWDPGSFQADRAFLLRTIQGAKERTGWERLDYTPAEIRYLLEVSREFKRMKYNGVPHRYLEGKNIVLLFEKTSTRTRCAFEVAGHDLGMGVTYLDPGSSQMGKKESIADTARVLGRMYDGIEYRGFGQTLVEELAAYAGVPVFNGLTNEFHPTQILADFLTVREHFGKLEGVKLVYLGDARFNMGNSLMVGCAKMGMHFVACAPKAYMPSPALVETCREIAGETGAVLEFIEDPMEATKDADVLYTDVWVSMGEPVEVWQERIEALGPYQVTKALMDNAGPRCRFMHCLPAFHDLDTKIGAQMGERFGITEMEVTDEVFRGPHSVVFDEAENRMHSIKAVLVATIGC